LRPESTRLRVDEERDEEDTGDKPRGEAFLFRCLILAEKREPLEEDDDAVVDWSINLLSC